MTIAKTIAVIITLALPPAALAQNPDTDDVCRDLGELAHTIMVARQNGVPMNEIVRIVGESDLAVGIVLDAYNQPRYSTEEFRDRAAADFRNDIEAFCYRVMMQ